MGAFKLEKHPRISRSVPGVHLETSISPHIPLHRRSPHFHNTPSRDIILWYPIVLLRHNRICSNPRANTHHHSNIRRTRRLRDRFPEFRQQPAASTNNCRNSRVRRCKKLHNRAILLDTSSWHVLLFQVREETRLRVVCIACGGRFSCCRRALG